MIKADFKTIQEALAQPRSNYFWASLADGKIETGNKLSFYADMPPDKYLSFDVSNTAIQAFCGLNGTITSLAIYRAAYRVEGSPGMWWYKDYSTAGPFSFSIETETGYYSLNEAGWPVKTSLLANLFPLTETRGAGMEITLLTFAPLSADGEKRPRAVISGILIKNISESRISGNIVLPGFRATGFDNMSGRGYFAMNFTGTADSRSRSPFDLAPGEDVWASIILSEPGEARIVDEINETGDLYWLNSTWSYFKEYAGKLTMPGDGFSAEFLERMAHLALGCINTDGLGNLLGCNTGVGTALTNEYILLKDIFYYFLPYSIFDPAFYKKCILWSLDYCIRPHGRMCVIGGVPGEKGKAEKTAGGVKHSLSIALMPVTMSGLYYALTGDKTFFTANAGLRERLTDILEQALKSREQGDIWLFPSDFISDFPSYGDYHTGSNIVAWYAFHAFARILREVYSDTGKASEFERVAADIKADLESRNVIDGPFGKQYIEGMNADGTVAVMGHEGEESDTTLMPFYGYADYDNPAYKNYTRFSMSEHNCFYVPEARGISPGAPGWGFAVSGHMTGLVNAVDHETLNGENGYMTEIKKLADVDGSLWWWPYGFKPEGYGKVLRCREDLAAKSGWAAGVYTALFVTQILGLAYDGPTKTLRFRPFSPSSGFTWEHFRFGSGIFSVFYSRLGDRVEITVSNENGHEIALDAKITLDIPPACATVTINGLDQAAEPAGQFLGKPAIAVRNVIMPASSITIVLSKKGADE